MLRMKWGGSRCLTKMYFSDIYIHRKSTNHRPHHGAEEGVMKLLKNRRAEVARRNIPKSCAAERRRKRALTQDICLVLALALAAGFLSAGLFEDLPILKLTYPDVECVGIWTKADGERGAVACQDWLAAHPDARYEHAWVAPR